MYEIIEKNQYGVKVKNTKDIGACEICKHRYLPLEHNVCKKCYRDSYYLPDSEAERLERENPLMNTTIDDLYIESKCYFEVKKKLDDTQKELIDLRVELRVEKEKSKALEEYSRGLELKIGKLKESVSDEDVIEHIENALYSTHRFLTTQCSDLAIVIMQYIKEANISFIKNQK